MVWTFFQASEESASPWHLGCEQSPIVKQTDTLPLSYFLEWSGETLRQRQSGTMCELSKEPCSRTSTSSSEVSRARTLALRDAVQAWKASEADYSLKSFDLPENLNQLSFFSKTSLLSLPVGGLLLSERLPNWGMIAGGRFFQPLQLGPRKAVGDGFCLPTPTATDHKGGRSRARSKNLLKPWMNSYRDFCRQILGMRVPCPAFTEAVMGYPLGHTELSALATAWFRSARGKRLKL